MIEKLETRDIGMHGVTVHMDYKTVAHPKYITTYETKDGNVYTQKELQELAKEGKITNEDQVRPVFTREGDFIMDELVGSTISFEPAEGKSAPPTMGVWQISLGNGQSILASMLERHAEDAEQEYITLQDPCVVQQRRDGTVSLAPVFGTQRWMEVRRDTIKTRAPVGPEIAEAYVRFVVSNIAGLYLLKRAPSIDTEPLDSEGEAQDVVASEEGKPNLQLV